MPESRQLVGQSATNVGKTAGLGERHNFATGEYNIQGCLLREMFQTFTTRDSNGGYRGTSAIAVSARKPILCTAPWTLRERSGETSFHNCSSAA
jgi:hypothetical protein